MEKLCIQIIKLKPKKLILFEQSEINLYKILEDLKESLNQSKHTELIPILGSANNSKLLEKVLIFGLTEDTISMRVKFCLQKLTNGKNQK